MTERELNNLCSEDYRRMAERFEKAYDCNHAENDTWESVINGYQKDSRG